LASLALVVILTSFSSLNGSPAAAAAPTPDTPNRAYWLRTGLSVRAEPQPMAPRLQDIAQAFGRGDYRECRRLAENVILSEPQAHEGSVSPHLRAEAASFIIESHLAEGDFEVARTAAQRFHDQDAMARIATAESYLDDYVGNLDSLLGDAADRWQALRAQFWTGHVHHVVGRSARAKDAYAVLIRMAPHSIAARAAVRRLSLLVPWATSGPAALAEVDPLVEPHLNTEAAGALAELYHLIAQRSFAGHHWQAAALAWQKAAHFDPDPGGRAKGLLGAAQALLDLQRFDEVHACLAFVRQDPAFGGTEWRQTADYLGAITYHQEDDLENAILLLREIVDTATPHKYRVPAEALLRHLEDRTSG
jgi:tetratricopeptide (TPR) repeat protein